MHYDIFISYRREGGRDFARQVELALRGHGFQNIFFDYNSLRNGVFNEQIIDAINECKDYILILSEGSMDRCVNIDDWVAKEIRTALAAGCNFIPLTVGDFSDFPKDFPKDLRVMRNFQRSQLMTNEYFDDSIRHLVDRLDSIPVVNITQRTSNANSVGAEIHIYADANCSVYDYGKVINPSVRAFEDTIILLKKGNHDLKFISTEESEISSSMNYGIPENDYCDSIKVCLQSEISRLQSKRKREEERKQREEAIANENARKEAERKELNQKIENLKKALPPSITFTLPDGQQAIFELNYSKTQYSVKKQFLLKQKISQNSNSDNSKFLFFTLDLWCSIRDINKDLQELVEKEGLRIKITDDEYIIPFISNMLTNKYSRDYANFEYFVKKYLP